MEYFELTKELMAGAKTYMPLQTKKELAETIAHSCVHPMNRLKWNGIHLSPKTDADEEKDDPTALPDLMEEDIALKMCMLQNVLLSWYFDVDLDESKVGYEQYDYYAGGHLLNQIERFKSDRELKNAAFDLTEDFREFRKMVDTIIYNYKVNANDPLKRFDAMLTVFSSPENIQAMVSELQKVGDEIAPKTKNEKSPKKKKNTVVLESIPEA